MRRDRPARRARITWRRLTDQMEAEILSVIVKIDAAGGMYKAAESGLVQTMIGESALNAIRRRSSAARRKSSASTATNCDEDEAAGKPPNGRISNG